MTYYGAPHAFAEREMELAVTIARQLGFSLERLRPDDERRKAEKAKELLVAESRHRIKNTLTTVQAIASQTLRDSQAEGLNAFLSRLHALGEAHELLTTENWLQAPLHEVVARAIKPFQSEGTERFRLMGPDVWLPAQTSLMLTMCLHELATNAAKYGALSNGSGQIHIAWDRGSDRKAQLIWQQTGGPAVVSPKQKGFGTRLIESSGDGDSRLDYRPDGLYCSMSLSL
jgi:two-component sensor histidine kinase